jgi:hypothetical protein
MCNPPRQLPGRIAFLCKGFFAIISHARMHANARECTRMHEIVFGRFNLEYNYTNWLLGLPLSMSAGGVVSTIRGNGFREQPRIRDPKAIEKS